MNEWCIALGVLGFLLLFDGLAVLKSSKMNWGLALTMAIGGVLLLFALFFEQITLVPKVVLITTETIFAAGLALTFGVSLFLFIRGKRGTATFDEDAVVILGTSIRKGRMSTALKLRCQKGIAYALRNPKAILVVSGGMGRGETLAEADAMAQYMLMRGVSSNQLIIENQSRTTRENFAFSKAMLDRQLGSDYKLVFITSRFHVYRAARFALEASLQARSLGSATSLHMVIPCYLRETLAVLRLWILKY